MAKVRVYRETGWITAQTSQAQHEKQAATLPGSGGAATGVQAMKP
jgi:hypothetical protein